MNDGLMRDPTGLLPVYRRAGRWEGCLFVAVVIGSLPAGIGLSFALGKADKWLHITVALGPFVIAFIGMLIWMFRKNRARQHDLERGLRDDGFTPVLKPDIAAASALFGPIGHVTSVITRGPEAIKWLASQDLGSGALVRIFEHEYTTGSGKSTQVHQHTVVAWPAPAGWPMVELHRTGGLQRWWDRRRGRQDIEVGQEEFDKMWRVACASEAFVKAMLAGDARTVLLNSPGGERWIIGHGHVCCVTTGVLDIHNLRLFINRSKAFLARMPRGVWSADEAARA